ncbi:membrane protein [Aeropyrum pernix]|uniref:Membrane protein n=1 Tax=Aeropyrum pernix TaxID=56636 RepID=A0A401HBA3_AERPX|nr:membrane protein [Aeropyrum pernix]
MPGLPLYRVSVYASESEADRVREVLKGTKLYWYEYSPVFNSETSVAAFEIYAPEEALQDLLPGLYRAIDLRKRENAFYMEKVETGVGASRRVLSRRFLRSVRILRSRPLEEVLDEANDRSSVDLLQALLAAIAGVVALAGIITGSMILLVGAMLLSPILSPIYSAAVGLSFGRLEIAVRGGFSLLILTLLALASSTTAAVIVSVFLPGSDAVLGAARQAYTPHYIDLIIGFALGAAVSLAAVARLNEPLIGVAVAAALIPPLAALGLGLAFLDYELSLGSLAKASANMAGLLAGSTVTFNILRRLL